MTRYGGGAESSGKVDKTRASAAVSRFFQCSASRLGTSERGTGTPASSARDGSEMPRGEELRIHPVPQMWASGAKVVPLDSVTVDPEMLVISARWTVMGAVGG